MELFLPDLLAPAVEPAQRRSRAVPIAPAPTRAVDFAVFYETNINPLIRSLNATLMDTQLAQDAAQEAMARAYQQWSKVGAYDKPAGWCYRVGLNWSMSRFRKRRREITTDKTSDCPVAVASTLVDDELTAALLELAVPLRSVVVLRVLMDWSYEEIAEALQIPRGTVASRLHRALDQLRSTLDS